MLLQITVGSIGNRLKVSVENFAQKYHLGDPEFGNFYQAQYDSYCDILHEQIGFK